MSRPGDSSGKPARPHHTATSKRLAYILRHHPDSIGAELAPEGWADVATVLNGLGREGNRCRWRSWSRSSPTIPKGRYEFDDGHDRVRARQGHTVVVDLGLRAVRPPQVLFHGTAVRFLARIQDEGLRPMGRHRVHLSADVPTAAAVGGRRGPSVVLRVDAAAMDADGYTFFVSANGVWLVDSAPPRYLTQMAAPD